MSILHKARQGAPAFSGQPKLVAAVLVAVGAVVGMVALATATAAGPAGPAGPAQQGAR